MKSPKQEEIKKINNLEDLESFGEDEIIYTNIGNEIHFECFVPKENSKEIIEGIARGMEAIGIFRGI